MLTADEMHIQYISRKEKIILKLSEYPCFHLCRELRITLNFEEKSCEVQKIYHWHRIAKQTTKVYERVASEYQKNTWKPKAFDSPKTQLSG